MLRDAGGLSIVPNVEELTSWVGALLRDPVRRRAMGEAARGAICHHEELPHRTAAALLELMI
jgi:hypothetical protein